MVINDEQLIRKMLEKYRKDMRQKLMADTRKYLVQTEAVHIHT